MLNQNPHSADPDVRAYKALSSLDLLIAYCDASASKVGLTAAADKAEWTPELKPTTINTGGTGKTALATKLIHEAFLAGVNSYDEPSRIVPPDKLTVGEHGLAAKKSPWGPHSPSTFEDGNHKDQLNTSSAGSRTGAKFGRSPQNRHRKFGDRYKRR